MTEQIIPAASSVGFLLKRGQHLRLIDPNGGQTGDLVAFSVDGGERLSSGRTFDYGGKVHLSTGDVLWSDRSNPMLTFIADDVGRHDLFYAPCSREMYRIEYGLEDHANCHDNLCAALRQIGIDPRPFVISLNFFMDVAIGEGGKLSLRPPKHKAGAALVLRADMDLAVALSACPASVCNGGAPPRPLAYEIL